MKPKPILVIFSILFLVGIIFVYQAGKSEKQKCLVQTKTEIVRDSSMEPLIKSGEEIKALFGYYNCEPIKRDDIVLVKYSGNEHPLIKIVKAIPEDKFHLQETENGWHILVNDKILKNSEGKPYLLNNQRKKMLSLYENDYQGIIPENAYLVLGNNSFGSRDSTKFDLIGNQPLWLKWINNTRVKQFNYDTEIGFG